MAIARELDRLAPEAGLYPRDRERRAAIEQAERLGHDELQPIARRIFRWAGARDNAVRAWMAKEVIGARAPALAGYGLKPAIAREDLRPAIAPRPCGKAALRLIPDYPRSGFDALPPVPASLPPEWLLAAPAATDTHLRRSE